MTKYKKTIAMKRIISITLALILISSLFGCKTKPHNENDDASPIIEENLDSTGSKQTQSTNIPEQEKQESSEQTEEQSEEKNNDQPPSEQAEEQSDNQKNNSQPSPEQAEQPQQSEKDDSSSQSTTSNTENEKYIPYEPDGEIDVYYPKDPFPHLDRSASDVFIGKILETKFIREPVAVPYFYGFEKGAMVYKIQIEKVYRGTCVTENTTVYLFKSIEIVKNMYSFNEDDYAHVNEKYIFDAMVKPVNNEPVLINSEFFSPKIEEDGKLTATNQTTKKGLEKISTLEAFDNSEELNEIWKTDFKNLYDTFTRYIKTDKTEQELIAELKKAIIADSEFKMNLNTEQASN